MQRGDEYRIIRVQIGQTGATRTDILLPDSLEDALIRAETGDIIVAKQANRIVRFAVVQLTRLRVNNEHEWVEI